MTQPSYPMTIHLAVGAPLVLTRVEPVTSDREYADTVERAVESSEQQVGGDGEREPHWKKFNTWLPTSGRPSERAATLAAFEDALRYATYVEIDGLRYPIDRIRVKSTSFYTHGYLLAMEMIGPYPEFQVVDASGNPAGPAPLW